MRDIFYCNAPFLLASRTNYPSLSIGKETGLTVLSGEVKYTNETYPLF